MEVEKAAAVREREELKRWKQQGFVIDDDYDSDLDDLEWSKVTKLNDHKTTTVLLHFFLMYFLKIADFL